MKTHAKSFFLSYLAVSAAWAAAPAAEPPELYAPVISTPPTHTVLRAKGEEPASFRSQIRTDLDLRHDVTVKRPALFQWEAHEAPSDSLIVPVQHTTDAAAGFPGEVIDEVIIPVPSEIFLVMDKLGRPDWKSELRHTKAPTFSNRIDVALVLGATVAEGFVAVQAEDRDAVERIGKDVLRLSESLGLKDIVLPHTNAILEAAKNGRWDAVRQELDKTQRTVRLTMEERRDGELSQCVSLGGWLRGTEAVTNIIHAHYTSDAAELLNQPDIIEHFQKQLRKLSGRHAKLKAMLNGLDRISNVIGSGEEPPSAQGIATIRQITSDLVKTISTAGR